MNRCLDESVGLKLYAYETGVLSEAESEQFELHLLECKYCNERAQAMARESHIIRNDPEVRRAVAKLAEPEQRSWYRSRIGRTALALAALLVLLVAKPWKFDTGGSDDVHAANDRLIILRFDNVDTSEAHARDGDIVANLLNTDLVTSVSSPVVSDQRVQDIRKLLRHESGDLDEPVSNLQIAREADARWLLTGKILQSRPVYVVTVEIVDVSSGNAIASRRLDGWPEATLFTLADSLSALVRNDLGMSTIASSGSYRSVTEVTTNSAEAYRHYLEGLDYYSQYYLREATTSFKEAVALDSTFAMAYYYLSRLESRRYLEAAVRFSNRATEKEQLYIASLQGTADNDIDLAMSKLEELVAKYPEEKEAWYLLAQYAFVKLHYTDVTRFAKRAIALDPLFKNPYNLLACSYHETGRVDSSEWAADAYVALAPDEPLPYHLRGWLQARQGHLIEAIESYDRALAIKRDFLSYNTFLAKGLAFAYLRNYDSAQATFDEIAQSDIKGARSAARTAIAIIPLLQGDFDRARQLLEDGIAADRLEQALAGADGDQDYKHYLLATISEAQGDLPTALRHTRDALEIINQVDPSGRLAYRYYLIQMLADNHQWAEARAILDSLKPETEEPSIAGTAYWYADGCINRAEENLEEALASYERASSELSGFHIEFMLARTLMDLEQYEKAVEVLEKQVGDFSMPKLRLPIWAVETHYLLGVACEATGRHKRAVEQYREFLNYWGEAGKDMALVADARARLGRLTANL
jgi:tetratricopeptide (TPR) repeat protein